MTTYHSLIIDDEPIARDVIRTYLKDDLSIETVGEACNGSEAVIKILQYKPDLIFLDIQMPEMDGFEVLKEVWPHHRPFVIFTTAFDQYALRAFEVNAIDYLLKPFDEIRFHQALGRIKERLSLQSQPRMEALVTRLLQQQAETGSAQYLQRILVKETGRMLLVKTEDISHFDADGNYITLHTAAKSYTIYESLSSLEERLNPADFIRVSRSYIININFIAELETYFNGEYIVLLQTGERIKCTRSYRENLKVFLTNLK
ncbi:Transcriptional regulatory protein BtsR [Dyadobacter sp. CECT 9275]|uniref:Transcriptional regulatory protein BtsR n=1 Tax=Dyadobacter helix TaxID=2822344 RepID=A0A916NNV2_9BACT|nr:LytTR family DNA-binding domain-containing protein [Dyadobacter sp. CECT 9275]CAG5017267.1 Transcriptional regulatory protein BtsR [Dyadobacter sp. CECT 9275]